MPTTSKGKGKEEWTSQPWSQWTWDPDGYRYYRAQLQSNGSYAYEYRAADLGTVAGDPDTFAGTLDSKGLNSRGYQESVPGYVLTMEQAFNIYLHPLGFSGQVVYSKHCGLNLLETSPRMIANL